jgi:hypothetical protein
MIAGGLSFTVTQAAGTPAAPPPPPPPPLPQTVQLSGAMSALSGKCPTVSFRVGSTLISVNGQTSYSDGKCKDLSNGKQVSLTGTLQVDGSALATLINVSSN